MAKYNLSVTLQGKSGNAYKFNLYTLDEECADESGIYILGALTNNNQSFRTLYIGQAQSFQNRFYNHHKMNCAVKNGGNCLGLMQVANAKERETIELDLLAKYNTTCNEVNN